MVAVINVFSWLSPVLLGKYQYHLVESPVLRDNYQYHLVV